MRWFFILLALGVLVYDIRKERKEYSELRKFKKMLRESKRQERKEFWKKIRNFMVNPRNAAHMNDVVLNETKLYQGVILEFSFPKYRCSNLDYINKTLSGYALKEVTVKEHTGALVTPQNDDYAANRFLQYALKTCTLQCDLMPSGPGLDLQLSTMAFDKTVKDCGFLWQLKNPDRQLCKKVFRELGAAYVLVVVHHDKSRQLPKREIIPRDRNPQTGTAQRPSSQSTTHMSGNSGSSARSSAITVHHQGDTLYIKGRETLHFSHISGLSSFKKVVLGPDITRIGYAAFAGRTNLTDIHIPDGVWTIGRCAFRGCTGLTRISIPGRVWDIDTDTFIGCTGLTEVTMAKGVKIIHNGAFRDCTALTHVELPDSVEEIQEYAFSGCIGLTEVTIPDGVRKIADGTFHGCSGLKTIRIPDSVTEICPEAFSGCTGLASLTIPSNVRKIGDGAFRDVPHIRYDGALWERNNWGAKAAERPQGRKFFCGRPGKDTLNWHMVDDTLYIEGQGRLRCSEKNWHTHKIRHVVIAPGCTAIADQVFSHHRNLESIVLPDTLRTIGARTFAECTSLKEIHIPDSVIGIGTAAFVNCTQLQQIHLPEKLAQIHDDTFRSCRNLKDVQIPDGVHYIGSRAFYEVASIANLPLNLGNWGVKTPAYRTRICGLGENAFANAGLPAHIEIPHWIDTIPDGAFYNCKNLISVKLPRYMDSIGEWAFASCTQLECLEIPKSVTEIGKYAFYGVPHILYQGPAQSDDNWGAKCLNNPSEGSPISPT